MSILKWFLSDKSLNENYVKAGKEFGSAVSYLYFGECIGFRQLLKRWEKWETKYANKGYRTVSLDAFVDFGGYGKPIKHLLLQKREASEQPRLYAKRYREKFLGKVAPVVNLEKMMEDGNP